MANTHFKGPVVSVNGFKPVDQNSQALTYLKSGTVTAVSYTHLTLPTNREV